MNKVKLTQEQATILESLLTDYEADQIVRQHIIGKWGDKYYSLAKLNNDEMIRALYIGYEVEQGYEVGDWIKSKLGKGIGKIIDIDDAWYWTDFGLAVPKEDDVIRYATDEEIAKEKQRRDEKLDKILLELTDYERERLTVKLAGGNE